MKEKPMSIPNYWNHLNIYEESTTRLIHYTKEPEQPWYKPDHSLAAMWEFELAKAIASKDVLRGDFIHALRLWSAPRIDSRPKQGLHPYYEKYLKSFID
jgi:antirestriction protein ArdC